MLPLCSVLGPVQEGAGRPKEGQHSDQGPGAALRLRGCLDWDREARGDPTHGDTSHRGTESGCAQQHQDKHKRQQIGAQELLLRKHCCAGGGWSWHREQVGAGGCSWGVSDPSWEPWDGRSAAASASTTLPSRVPPAAHPDPGSSRRRRSGTTLMCHRPEPGTELSTKDPTPLWH